jgi:hypothetical protein
VSRIICKYHTTPSWTTSVTKSYDWIRIWNPISHLRYIYLRPDWFLTKLRLTRQRCPIYRSFNIKQALPIHEYLQDGTKGSLRSNFSRQAGRNRKTNWMVSCQFLLPSPSNPTIPHGDLYPAPSSLANLLLLTSLNSPTRTKFSQITPKSSLPPPMVV